MAITKKANNPDAFPQTDQQGNCYTGMSLRDYFAAKAMQAIINRNAPHAGWSITDADQCYYVADVLLKARQDETI